MNEELQRCLRCDYDFKEKLVGLPVCHICGRLPFYSKGPGKKRWEKINKQRVFMSYYQVESIKCSNCENNGCHLSYRLSPFQRPDNKDVLRKEWTKMQQKEHSSE